MHIINKIVDKLFRSFDTQITQWIAPSIFKRDEIDSFMHINGVWRKAQQDKTPALFGTHGEKP